MALTDTTTIDESLCQIIDKCDRDLQKFWTGVRNAVKAKTDFFRKIENKEFLSTWFDEGCQSEAPYCANEQIHSESIVNATVNEKVSADQLDTDENSGHSLVINGTVTTDGDKTNDNEDEEIIPETQYAPNDNPANADEDDGSRPNSRNSMNSFTIAAEKSAKNRTQSDEVEGDEYIAVDEETEAQWQVDASQAIIHNSSFGHLDGIGFNSTAKSMSQDVDSERREICAGTSSAVKVTVTAAEESDETDETEADITALSYKTAGEPRSTSVTPDLTMSQLIPTASPNVRSSTPKNILPDEFDVLVDKVPTTDAAQSKVIGEASNQPIADDRDSVTPDLFDDENRQSHEEPTTSTSAMANDGARLVSLDDDSYSNDNELFGASTQVFPPPKPQPARTSIEKPLPSPPPNPNDDEMAVDNVLDGSDDSNSLFMAQTQPFRPPPPADSVPTSSHSSKTNTPNMPVFGRMAPPASTARNETAPADDEEDAEMFAAATQVFVTPAASKAREQSTSAKSAMSTRRKSRMPDSDDEWPPNTPTETVASRVTDKLIDDKEKRKKSKEPVEPKVLDKRWLFESPSDNDEDRPPAKRLKGDNQNPEASSIDSSKQQKHCDVRSVDVFPLTAAEIMRCKSAFVKVIRLDNIVNENVPSTDSLQRSRRTRDKSESKPVDLKGKKKSSRSSAKDNARAISDVLPSRATRSLAIEKANALSFDETKRRTRTRAQSRASADAPQINWSAKKDSGAIAVAVASSSSSLDVPLAKLVGRSRSKELRSDRSDQNQNKMISRSRSKSRKQEPKAYRIMLTKINMEEKNVKKAIESIPKMGGEITTSPVTCTVLVSERIYRTNKLMSSINRGIPIVTPEWLIASRKAKTFVDTEPYRLRDVDSEKRYSFTLKQSLEKAKKHPLYTGYVVLTTPNISPPPHEIAMIVECGGGQCIHTYTEQIPKKAKKFVVSSNIDAEVWEKIRTFHPKIPIISTEGFMRNVLHQKVDFDNYKLCI